MPTVEQLNARLFVIPLEEPESDGTFTWKETSVVLVEVKAGGECGLGFTYGPAACLSIIDVLSAAVLGNDALDVPAIWREMVASIRNAGRPGIASAAIAAVDIAMWD